MFGVLVMKGLITFLRRGHDLLVCCFGQSHTHAEFPEESDNFDCPIFLGVACAWGVDGGRRKGRGECVDG